MKAAQMIRQSIRSLLLHRLRALLSSLGVLFGVAAVIAMGAIAEGAKQQALAQIKQLGTHTIIVRGAGAGDVYRLRAALPTLSNLAPVAESEETLATTPEFAQIRRLRLTAGRFLCPSDMRGPHQVCVVGAERGQRLSDAVRLTEATYTVVGVLAPVHWEASDQPALATRNLNQLLITPLLHGAPLDEIILQVSDADEIERTARAVSHLLSANEDVEIVVPHTLLAQAQRTQRTFSLVLGSIAAISLLVGGIGIANIMLATVSERRREIGIRRALGATRQNIALQFLCETTLLTLLGGIGGLFVGFGLASAVAHFAGWPISFSPILTIFALATALLTGLCAGLSPAVRAAKENPVAALALQ
jgi:putative ABC transport system permease protein